MEKVVVLPAPFGPRSPTTSPPLAFRSTPRTTSFLPKVLRSPQTERRCGAGFKDPFPFAQSQGQESEEAPASVGRRPHRLAHELCVFPFPKQYDCRLRHPILRLPLEPACPQEGLRLSGHPCQANRKRKCDLLETASPCPKQKYGICDRSHPNLNFAPFRIPPSFYHWSEAIPRLPPKRCLRGRSDGLFRSQSGIRWNRLGRP